MTLVPNPQHIHLLSPYYDPDEPVIFQEFIQHDGVIFKIYVVDGTSHVQVRPSFKNVTLEGNRRLRSTGQNEIVLKLFDLLYLDDLLHFDSQVVPKAFEQDTQTQNGRRHQVNGHSDPIRQAFLTRDIHNMRAKKEAVFDHQKIKLITQRLFEQLVGQGRAVQCRAGQSRTVQSKLLVY